MTVCFLAVAWMPAFDQRPASPGVADSQTQGLATASLNDALLARATGLYYSAAKAGLKGFDCQVHPDWMVTMSSARNGNAVAADDPNLALLNAVRITLHARLSGGSNLDWQAPTETGKTAEPSAAAMLEQTHRGMEQVWVGLLKLWIPLVDGSIAESLGEEDVEIVKTESGYTLRSKDNAYGLTEEFDNDLTLRRFITADSGSTVNLEPAFQHTGQGLLLSSFAAHIEPAGAQPRASQEMRVNLEYKSISNILIPSRLTMEMPGLVRMDFKLDGCKVNPR